MPGQNASKKAQTGKGATVWVAPYVDGDEGPAANALVKIANIVSVNPNISMGEVESTDLESDWDTYLATNGSAESGIVVRHAQGDPGIVKVLQLTASGAEVWIQIKEKDTSTITFHGFLKGYNITFENKTIVDADVPIRVNCPPLFVAGAAT